MAREQKRAVLSKSILEMKFMKRTKEKVDKELEETEGREMYSDKITKEMREAAGSFVVETSFTFCEDLLVGRLSYRGMNPEIERLMELDNLDASRIIDKQKETEVSDKEMAAFFNPLVKTMGSKFNKRQAADDTRSSEPPHKRGKHKADFFPQTPDRKRPQTSTPQHHNKKQKFMKPQDD